ncbi:hypothetical protein GE09DRAFT_1261557, partial [Coniochaeta sp. 2T2.1]
ALGPRRAHDYPPTGWLGSGLPSYDPVRRRIPFSPPAYRCRAVLRFVLLAVIGDAFVVETLHGGKREQEEALRFASLSRTSRVVRDRRDGGCLDPPVQPELLHLNSACLCSSQRSWSLRSIFPGTESMLVPVSSGILFSARVGIGTISSPAGTVGANIDSLTCPAAPQSACCSMDGAVRVSPFQRRQVPRGCHEFRGSADAITGTLSPGTQTTFQELGPHHVPETILPIGGVQPYVMCVVGVLEARG